jgi:hypothetical protein
MAGWALTPEHPGQTRGWLARAVYGLDGRLRRRLSVFEYTTNPSCVFRARITTLSHPVLLMDGTRIEPGLRILDLHMWNEQVAVLPRDHSLSLARRLSRCFDLSLRELAAYVDRRPELADVAWVRGDLAFGPAGHGVGLASRCGFVAASPRTRMSLLGLLHRFGENILILMFILAGDAHALRPGRLWRARTEVFMSRATLENRYGEPAAGASVST